MAQTYVPDEVLVGVKDSQDDANIPNRLLAALNTATDKALVPNFLAAPARYLYHFANINVHHLKLKEGLSVPDAIALLKQVPGVTYAEPNYIRHTASLPNDSYWGTSWTQANTKQYAPHLIMADAAWNIWQPRIGTIVAVIDSGIDYAHPDLTNVLYRDFNGQIIGKNFSGTTAANDDANVDPGLTRDDFGHGTAVAGILAAQVDNYIGIAGIAGWNGVAGSTNTSWIKILPVKATNNAGAAPDNALMMSVDYAVTEGAKVINISLADPMSSTSLNSSIQKAYQKGVVIIAAAGNGTNDNYLATNVSQYPACYNNVLAVAATDHTDMLTAYSDYGPLVNVAAPGGIRNGNDDILTTSPTYSTYTNSPLNYGYGTGTSFSCPQVAGEAALMLCQNPLLLPDNVYGIIINAVEPVTPNPAVPGQAIRNGRVNVYRAVRAALGSRATSDFNLDSVPDVLIWNASTGSVATWLLNSAGTGIGTNTTITASGDTNWKVVGIGDLNNDGEADILYQNSATGQVAVWLMSGTSVSGILTIGNNTDTNWKAFGLADINRDGYLDIVFQNSSTGQVAVWYMYGTTFTSSVTLHSPTSNAIKLVGIADFNNDQYSDLMLQNTTNGAVYCVLLQQGTVLSTPTLYAGGDNTYSVVAVAQGNPGLANEVNVYFQNATTGNVNYWITNYTVSGNSTAIEYQGTTWSTGSPAWKVVGTADLNNDGQKDLLIQNSTSGAVVYWLLNNGNGISSSGYIWNGGDANWKVVSPRPR